MRFIFCVTVMPQGREVRMNLSQEILKQKKEKDVVILAHYYVDGAVQEIADFVGDSYALAKKAADGPP